MNSKAHARVIPSARSRWSLRRAHGSAARAPVRSRYSSTIFSKHLNKVKETSVFLLRSTRACACDTRSTL